MLDPFQSHQTQVLGGPQDGRLHVHQCEPGPPSTCTTPSPHFQGKDPPKQPKPPRR